MTTQKFYLPPRPLYMTLHPLYLFHQTQCINCIRPTFCTTLHTICMTSHSICMTSHEHFMTSHWYKYDITSSISMTSYPIYIISPILFHENKTTIPGISPTLLTSQPLHLCGHTTLSMPSQQLWKSSHLAHVWHHTHPTSHQIQTLWHQSSVFRTSQTLHSWHQISYIWHHIHSLCHLIPNTCEITATISVT